MKSIIADMSSFTHAVAIVAMVIAIVLSFTGKGSRIRALGNHAWLAISFTFALSILSGTLTFAGNTFAMHRMLDQTKFEHMQFLLTDTEANIAMIADIDDSDLQNSKREMVASIPALKRDFTDAQAAMAKWR